MGAPTVASNARGRNAAPIGATCTCTLCFNWQGRKRWHWCAAHSVLSWPAQAAQSDQAF